MQKPIYVFYHLYCVNDHLLRFLKTYDKIVNSGLIQKCDNIFVNLTGPEKDKAGLLLKHLQKIKISFSDNDASEIDTLDFLWEKSKSEDFYALYLHCKGVTKTDNPNIQYWIDYLEYFNIEKHDLCLEKLKNYDTCGVEIKDNPYTHYCGNFWWANSSYIRKIEKMSVTSFECKLSEKWHCEFWIIGKNEGKFCTLNQSFLEFNFYLFPFFENFYKLKKNNWPYNTKDVVSAWKGLEDYILEILNRYNVKRNIALEFGVDYGYSTDILSQVFNKVVGVDTFLSDIHTEHEQGDDFYYNIKNSFNKTNIDLYRLGYKSFIKNNNEFYDLIHIDIIHRYSETYECAEWAINHSNVVILHDTIAFPEVNDVCRDLSLKYKLGYNNIEYHNGLGILYKNHT
jgi:hypothetical protein